MLYRVEVALLHPRDRRDFPMRPRHVLGDHAPDTAERLAAALGLGAAGSGLADVLLRDPALRASPRQAVEVDTELLGNLADERRRAHSFVRSRHVSSRHWGLTQGQTLGLTP